MILAACGGRDNGEKYAEGLARAVSGEGSGKWEVGRVDRKEGGWGGVDGNEEGDMGKGVIGTGRGWQWGGGCEEDMERGAMGKLGGKIGRGQWGGERGRDGEGEKKGQEEGRFHRWI